MNHPGDSSLPAMSSGHWPELARYWRQTGAPLRPSPEDGGIYARLAREWIDRHGPSRILLLGVTPEIFGLPWPAGHTFTAVDRTPAMIEHVWPGRREDVLCTDWLSFNLPPRSRDLVFCDGGLHLLSYPDDQARLVARLHDVLAPGGRCIFRLFVPPAQPESPDSVLADLLAGRIENLNLLKLRLGMALQRSPESGTPVRLVWERVNLAAQGRNLGVLLGREPEHWQAIDAYRNSEACYHFVSVAEVRELFCGAGRFIFLEQVTPSYPLGERCPFVVFEKR